MSDVSKTNEALIAEAQEHYSEMNGLNSRAAEVMMELVAALESATRAPSSVEIEALGGLKEWLADNRPLRCIIDYGNEGDRQDDYDQILAVIDAALESATRLPEQGEASERVKKIILESLVFINENSDPWARLLTESILAALDGAPEPDGTRWYAACWRDDNGRLNSLESSTVLREYAEADVKRWRDQERRELNGQPDRVVLASKISSTWLPVDGPQS